MKSTGALMTIATDLAKRIHGIVHDANRTPLYDTIQTFENLADVRAVTALISASPVRAAVAA